MQKILYVITKSNWGGAQRYVFDLATSLTKPEWDVTVVLGGTGKPDAPGGRLEQELRHRDIRTIFVPAFMRDMSLRREWRVLRDLWDLFAREQPDVVHLNSSKAGGLGALAARLAGVPHIVYTVHGLPWHEDRNPVAKFLIRLASWCTFLLCHTVIVISQDAYREARPLPFCKNKVRLVHNGLGALTFTSREEARAKLGLDHADAPVIGAVGELTWNKGYHTLLRAAEMLKRRGRTFTLCIIGEGEERKFLETIIDEESLGDSVRLAGFIAEAYRYMPAFDVYVLPSLKEGLPYALMEAGQAGLGVVASRVGGVADIVEDKLSGRLYPAKNAGELADQLEELLGREELRRTFGNALRQKVITEFSHERMLQKTLECYARS